MQLLFFVTLCAFLHAVCGNAARTIQARSGNPWTSVAGNYLAALCVAGGYCLWLQPELAGWSNAVLCGALTGFFYTVALIAIIRNMAGRGMAITQAVCQMSMIAPALLGIAFGEQPSLLQYIGILVVLAAAWPLSMATVRGRHIHLPPSVPLLLLMFVLQAGAMSGNLIASKLVAPESMGLYYPAVFGFGLIVSVVAWAAFRRPSKPGDLRRGCILGVLSAPTTISMVVASVRVGGAVFFPASGVLSLTITVLLAVWFWRERIQVWGWIGLALVAAAIAMLVS